MGLTVFNGHKSFEGLGTTTSGSQLRNKDYLIYFEIFLRSQFKVEKYQRHNYSINKY